MQRGLGETPPEYSRIEDLTPLDELPATIGRFQVVRELGRGGGGVVYLAHDPALGRQVALKVPRLEIILTPTLRRRFLREGQAAALLNHPNITPIHEAGTAGSVCYIVSSYCPGPTLAQWLRDHSEPVAPSDAALLIERLAEAMAHAHERGILHRDLKPSNILLEVTSGAATTNPSPLTPNHSPITHHSALTTYQPKIADFGLAKVVLDGEEVTGTGVLLGTTTYMAPEQTRGTKDLGPACDLWALGVILYEVLTQHKPFSGSTAVEVMQAIQTCEPVAPRRLRADVPPDLETICLKCLEKVPENRYASAGALAEELRRWQSGEPILARPVGNVERSVKWARRNPVVATLTSAVAVLLLGGTGISTYFAIQAIEERDRAGAKATEAQTNAKTAQLETQRADQRAEDLRKQLYISNVNRALSEWQSNNVALAAELLDACPEDLRGWEWHYTRRACYQERVAIYGNGGPGNNWYGNIAHKIIAFSPDSQWVASMDWDHALKLWDTATGTRCRVMQGDTGLVLSVAFSPDGKWVASGNGDHTVRLWSTETGELLHTLRGHGFLVYRVQFHPDGKGIISARPVLVDNEEWLSEMEIIVWEAASGRQLSRKVAADANPLWGGVGFSSDGRHFATGGKEYSVKLGDTDTGRCSHTLKGHTGVITDCAFRPDGKVMATACHDATIRLWTATGLEIRTLHGHTGRVHSVAFSPDGTKLASGGIDNSVRLWDSATGQEVAILRGHTSSVQSVIFSPDGQSIASAGEDGTVRLWGALQSLQPVTLSGHTGWPSDVIFSPDGQRLFSFSGMSCRNA